MDIRKFGQLLSFVITTCFLLSQTSQAYLAHVDVLAKVIQMPDGTEKVDIAIVGSDLHRTGTIESNWDLLLNLAGCSDFKGNVVEMYVEDSNSSSYARDISMSYKQWFDRILLADFLAALASKNSSNPIDHSPILTFGLLPEIYERMEVLDLSIEFKKFFEQMKITNLECRVLPGLEDLIEDLRNKNEQIPHDLKVYRGFGIFDLVAELYSSNYFQKMLQYLESWEKNSASIELKQIFFSIKKEYNRLVERRYQPLAEACQSAGMSYDGMLINAIEACSLDIGTKDGDEASKKLLYQMQIQALDILIMLQNIACDICFNLIEAKALWHIGQADTRPSNRTISLMGGRHANAIMSSPYLRIAPNIDKNFIENDLSLVASLRKIGYVQIDCLNMFEITRGDSDFLRPERVAEIAPEEFNIFAVKVSDFILKWTSISDDEVRALLARS